MKIRYRLIKNPTTSRPPLQRPKNTTINPSWPYQCISFLPRDACSVSAVLLW